MSVAERLREIERRYGRESVVVRALDGASEALSGMVARTEARLAEHPGPAHGAGTFSARKTSSKSPLRR